MLSGAVATRTFYWRATGAASVRGDESEFSLIYRWEAAGWIPLADPIVCGGLSVLRRRGPGAHAAQIENQAGVLHYWAATGVQGDRC